MVMFLEFFPGVCNTSLSEMVMDLLSFIELDSSSMVASVSTSILSLANCQFNLLCELATRILLGRMVQFCLLQMWSMQLLEEWLTIKWVQCMLGIIEDAICIFSISCVINLSILLFVNRTSYENSINDIQASAQKWYLKSVFKNMYPYWMLACLLQEEMQPFQTNDLLNAYSCEHLVIHTHMAMGMSFLCIWWNGL